MGWFSQEKESDADDDFNADADDEYPNDQEIRMFEEQPRVLPAGRYTVVARVVEAKDVLAITSFDLIQTITTFSFKSQQENGDALPNVVAKVKLERAGFPSQKRKTICERETSQPLWNQNFFFDEMELANGELEGCTCTFDVCDERRFGKDKRIGTVELECAKVYEEQQHEVWQRWYHLTDPTGKRQGSQGQVKLCLQILRQGDEGTAAHMDDVSDDNDDSDSDDDEETKQNKRAKKSFMDSLLDLTKNKLDEPAEEGEIEIWAIKANVYTGKDLPRMDWPNLGGAGIDAYLKMSCGSSALPACSKVKRSKNPEWNQEVIMRVRVAGGKFGGVGALPPCRLSIMDHDLTGSDDHVASTQILIRDIVANPQKFSRPKWYCFYGGTRNLEASFIGHVSKLAKRMNAGYLQGSAYRGRVLMSLEATREEDGKRAARAKTRIEKVKEKYSKEWPCVLHCDVLDVELFQTDARGKKCHVEVEMGLSKRLSPKSVLKSEHKPLIKECYAEINSALAPLQVKLPAPFEGRHAGSSAPDCFIRVCVAGKSVGFARVPATQLMPVYSTPGPMKRPDEAKLPNGWNVQGWFQLQADALSNHKKGQSRSLEHVKPVGQVLVRMILCGSENVKRNAKADTGNADEEGLNEEELAKLKAETKDLSPAEKRQAEEIAARRKEMERKMKGAIDDIEPYKLAPMEKRKFMLHVEAYQAMNLPAADPNGSSDPVAVIRVGRSVVQTQTMKSTVSPSWFRDMFVEIELPLLPPTAIDPNTSKSDGDSDDSDYDDSDSDDSDLDDADDDDRVDHLESKLLKQKMKEFKKLNKQKKRGIKAVNLQGLEGIAWWAAPAMTILVFDEDKATLISGADIDPLSVLMVPLLHPSEMRAKNAGSLGGFSNLASSVSFFSDFTLDAKHPERYDEIMKRVRSTSHTDPHPVPEWYEMTRLNPNSADMNANGGELLMHYEVLPLPFMGVANFVLGPVIKVQWENVKPRLEHIATRQIRDYFGFEAVEVKVCLMGVRGLLPFKQFSISMPQVEIELTGCIPLFEGSMEHVKSTAFRNLPNGPNANFNGQTLTLRGLVPKLNKIYTSLSIRVIDCRPIKRLIGAAEHEVFLRREEIDALMEKKTSNFVTVKKKDLAGDELEKLREILREETVSNYSVDIDDETATMVSQSNTCSEASDASYWRNREEILLQNDEIRSQAAKSGFMSRFSEALTGPQKSSRDNDIESINRKASRSGLFSGLSSKKTKERLLQESISLKYKSEVERLSENEEGSGGKTIRELRKSRKRRFLKMNEDAQKEKDFVRSGSISASQQLAHAAAMNEMMSKYTKSKSRRMQTIIEAKAFGDDSCSESSSQNSTKDGSGLDTDSDPGSDMDEAERIELEKLKQQAEQLEIELLNRQQPEDEDENRTKKKQKVPTFDDGSGDIPVWMDGRAFLNIGTVETELGDVSMSCVPIYRAEGFEDNSSKREIGGYVKLCYSVSELRKKNFEHSDEEEEYIHGPEELLKLDFLGNPKKDKPSVAAKKAKNAAIMQNTLWTPDETTATIPDEEFSKIKKQAGGYLNDNQPLMGEQPRPVTVRAYVIRGKGLRPIDQSGLCDPYLQLSVPGTNIVFGSSKDRIDRTCTPWFYKTFEYKTELPGNGLLRFDLYDFEKYSSDVFLGHCLVDVEARLLSERWSSEFSDKPPLEVRKLLDKHGNEGFGELEIIVEIHEGHDNVPKAIVIQPPPVVEVEMRVCVFKARNMVNKDVGGKNDLYFKLNVIGLDRTSARFSETQSTDIHWFAQKGEGSFNYRNIFPLTLPCNRIGLRVSAYDKDLLTGDDNIGENKINLNQMCKELIRKVSTFGEMSPECVVEYKYDPIADESFAERFNVFQKMLDGPQIGKWVKMYHPTLPGESQGEVEIMITLLPKKQALERPVGKGRELPNRDPELAEPTRARLSIFNPLGSLVLLMGPDMAWKVLFVVAVAGSLYMFVMAAFFIINDIVNAEITNAINAKQEMEMQAQVEREQFAAGAKAWVMHETGLDTLEERVRTKLNETKTSVIDATGLAPVIEKYQEIKSEIDAASANATYANSAEDGSGSTTYPPGTANASAPAQVQVQVVYVPVPAGTPIPANDTGFSPATDGTDGEEPAEAVATPTTVTEARFGNNVLPRINRYEFEDEQDRLNSKTDGDELDEWFSKYSLLGEEEKAQGARKHAFVSHAQQQQRENLLSPRLGNAQEQGQPKLSHRKMLLPKYADRNSKK